MKKSLIALAVAGAFAAPAFAATSNVDVYGKLHLSVAAVKDGAATSNDMQVSSNASRIGFKGTEDLGGGMAALWQIEQTVDIEEQGGSFATRDSFLGLKGGFGTVLLGNMDLPSKVVGRKVELFGDTIGDFRNLTRRGSTLDERVKNVIAYAAPSMGGISVTAAYTNDNGSSTADQSKGSAYNVGATYSNGPIYAGVSYSDGNLYADNSAWRVVGGYSFGDFRLVALYDKADKAYDAWMLGGAYKMGPMTFKANYMAGEKDVANAKDSKQWNVGMDYSLSKRTTLYVMYSDLDDAGNWGATLGGGVGSTDRIGTNAGKDATALSLGMIHSF